MTYEEAGYIIGNIPVPTDNKSYSIEDYQEAKTLAVAALWDKSDSVKQGEWVEDINELNKYCSICHKVCGTIYEHENYCPNCGAKMSIEQAN